MPNCSGNGRVKIPESNRYKYQKNTAGTENQPSGTRL